MKNIQAYNKTSTAILAGAVVTLLVHWVPMPPVEAGALQTIVTATLVYLIPNLPAR